MSGAPRGKPYVEAFPVLSLTAAKRAWAKGQRFIEWRNEQGVVIGHGEVVAISEAAFSFEHRFFGTPNVQKASGSNELRLCMRKVNPQRIALEIVCPKKQCNVDKIYFVRGEWGCRVCHDLTHVIKRLSPRHKTIVERDALSAKLENNPPQQRRTRAYHNARRKLERLQRETAETPDIPQELLFRAVGRWLEPGELPKISIYPGDEGYGWVPGERGGLKAFVAPEPPAPVTGPRLWLTRFSRALPLLGLQLFTGNLMGLLKEHVTEGIAEAAQALHVQDMSRGELAGVVAKAIAIQRLELDAADLNIQNRLDEEGRLQVYTKLAYSGGSRLLRVKAPKSRVSPLLQATFNESHITFATNPVGEEAAMAEQVVRLGVQRLEQQFLAQGEVLDRYDANLLKNANGIAAAMLSRHGHGKPPGVIDIAFEK